MRSRKPFSTAAIAVAGVLLVVLILVLGTLWMSRSAGRDTEDAVSSVSRLYLDELAGRREQVVSDNLRENIDRIGIAIGLMTEEDLSDVPHLQESGRNDMIPPGRLFSSFKSILRIIVLPIPCFVNTEFAKNHGRTLPEPLPDPADVRTIVPPSRGPVRSPGSRRGCPP